MELDTEFEIVPAMGIGNVVVCRVGVLKDALVVETWWARIRSETGIARASIKIYSCESTKWRGRSRTGNETKRGIIRLARLLNTFRIAVLQVVPVVAKPQVVHPI